MILDVNTYNFKMVSGMIKFILPIVVFIFLLLFREHGISSHSGIYSWTNSSSKGKKMIAIGLIIALIIGISLTIYLIFD